MNINRVDIICTLVTIQLLSVLIYLIAYFYQMFIKHP